MLISHCLTGNMHAEELVKEDASFGGNFGCTFTLLSKDGIIGYQSGQSQVAALPNVLHTCFYHKIGTEIKNNGSQFSKTFRAYIVGKTIDEIKETIEKIQHTVEVRNTSGENMLYDNFDVSLISEDY